MRLTDLAQKTGMMLARLDTEMGQAKEIIKDLEDKMGQQTRNSNTHQLGRNGMWPIRDPDMEDVGYVMLMITTSQTALRIQMEYQSRETGKGHPRWPRDDQTKHVAYQTTSQTKHQESAYTWICPWGKTETAD